MTMQQGRRHQNDLRGWRRRTRATWVRLSVPWIVLFAAVIAVLETAAAHAQIAKYDVPGLDENFRPDFKDSDAYFQFPSNLRPSHQLTGPMVGHVSSHQAIIWAHAGPDHDLVVKYQPADGSGSRQVTKMVVRADRHHSATAQLKGLRENARYEYQVFLDGKTDRAWKGWFTTAPPKGESTNFKMAFASCFGQGYQRRGQDPERLTVPTGASWYLLMAQQPAFHLLLGDNIYGNSTDYEYLWKCHMEERRINRPFASVIRQVPTYAVWDDHDYGRNNSVSKFELKDSALNIHKNFWANPYYGENDNPGIYSSFSLYDSEFLMLDCRYHANQKQSTLLGEKQFEWLINKIKSSKAHYIFIINGIQFLTKDGHHESYIRSYPSEFDSLMHVIDEQKDKEIVLLTGDRHFTELIADTLKSGKTIYEFTCSPLSSPVRPYYSAKEQKNPLLIKNSIVDEHNYGKINITGPEKNRHCIIEVFNNKGILIWKYDLTEHKFIKTHEEP